LQSLSNKRVAVSSCHCISLNYGISSKVVTLVARIVIQQMIPVVGHVKQLFVRSFFTHEIKCSYRCLCQSSCFISDTTYPTCVTIGYCVYV